MKEETSGMGWRVSVSIISFFGLLIFFIIWLFFYAGTFNIYQNIAVVIAAILVFVGVNGAAWAPWGMKHGCDDKPKSKKK
jgi:hypothetical protein